ncbi:cysteine-rich receptor protein kinase [Trifolium repens]|nr:cysteine-rich receptor protein kinase [Trifolium repens]
MAYNLKLFSITLLFCIIFSPTETASTFSHYNCTSIQTFSPNSNYKTNLNKLLSTLSSKASDTINLRYYNNSISTIDETKDTIYGLFMCIGYTNYCGECVKNSAKTLTSMCDSKKEAIIWSDECMVRYSNRSFFDIMEESPSRCVQDSLYYQGSLDGFNKMLSSLMVDLVTQVNEVSMGKKATKYVLKKSIYFEDKLLHGLAQCIPDISNDNCMKCLKDAIDYLQNSCAKGKISGSVLYPSCIVRYDPYPFHTQPIGKEKKNGPDLYFIVFHIIAPVSIFFLAVFLFVYYALYRRARKNLKYQKQNFGEDISSEVNSLQFDFNMIRLATNKFSDDNKIGEGGFGDVYKGMFPNGFEIAVKRLIRNSSQGALEFKNEVLLIAKLQHRNLVRLLGFCIQRNEKILIYEYMHNKSLDYYLFSPENHKILTWHARYKIIRGIARGILYLHEDSHLKIIHCDLKPSNILLDDKMNAKISDFGLARIVAIDQMQGNTSIIAGTYGYMSPEYAMLGQFSEKSDVFSFGVIILEIVSGKRNVDYNGVNSIDDLVSHAWKKWRENKELELLDAALKYSFSETEVYRCIQIGLLCVQENPDQRPTMATIALYFNCDSIDLPCPQQPPFYMRGKIEPRVARPRSYSVTRF